MIKIKKERVKDVKNMYKLRKEKIKWKQINFLMTNV
jgi:hypothetical protein